MIYLSICIPTYNRSNYLLKTIESIISQPEFTETDEVEIVVSDNCSTDDTEELMQQFLISYPSKIKYYRNEENILDRNYERVLSMGSGAMLKLNNDTLILNQNSLGKILVIVKHCLLNDLIPFFLNGEIKNHEDNIICTNEVSFISTVSYRCTWIGSFLISKKEFNKIEDFSSMAHLMLTQVNVLFELLRKGNRIIVIPEKFSTAVAPARKGGYNLPRIFLTNYFEILEPYFLDSNGIKAYNHEKKKILYKFVLPWLVDLYKSKLDKTDRFIFDDAGYRQIIKQQFSYITYLNFQVLLNWRIVASFFKVKLKNTYKIIYEK